MTGAGVDSPSVTERSGDEQTDGSGAGDAGLVDFEDGSAGADARMGDRTANPAGVGQRAAGEPGRTVPGASPIGTAGMDPCGVGRVGEQPTGKVLLADESGKEVSAKRGSELGTPFGGDWPGVEDGLKRGAC